MNTKTTIIIIAALAAFTSFAGSIIEEECDRAKALADTVRIAEAKEKSVAKSTMKRAAKINDRKWEILLGEGSFEPETAAEKIRRDQKLEAIELGIRADIERLAIEAANAKGSAERDLKLGDIKANFELLKLTLSKREALWRKL